MSTENLDQNAGDIRALAAQIVAGYVSRNEVAVDNVPQLVRDVVESLKGAATMPKEPAVSPDKSITPDYIICLEDGRKLKSMKRHLKRAYQLTPDAYRRRWGLPIDYPMVAPNYSRHRSALAKKIGLGRTATKKAPVRAARKAVRKTAKR